MVKDRNHDHVYGEKLDAGNIISQRAIAIEQDDNVGSMHDKLSF